MSVCMCSGPSNMFMTLSPNESCVYACAHVKAREKTRIEMHKLISCVPWELYGSNISNHRKGLIEAISNPSNNQFIFHLIHSQSLKLWITDTNLQEEIYLQSNCAAEYPVLCTCFMKFAYFNPIPHNQQQQRKQLGREKPEKAWETKGA